MEIELQLCTILEDKIMKNLCLFVALLFIGCQKNSIIIENCNNAYDKTEEALEQLQQVKNLVVSYAQNGQTKLSSEQMMKVIMPKANIVADLLSEAGQYLNDCVVKDEGLYKLRKEIQSLTACEKRIRNIYTLCGNNYLMSIGGYDNEMQLITVSMDNTANDIINIALSIKAATNSL